jgi:TonB family protein
MTKNQRQSHSDHPNKKRNVSFIVISIILHLLLMVSFLKYSDYLKTIPPVTAIEQQPSVQFVDMAELDKMRGELVEQDDSKKDPKKPKDAKYLSEKNKTVEKETKSTVRGEFQNKKSTTAQTPKPAQAQKAATSAAAEKMAPEMQTFTHGDLPVAAPSKKPAKAKTISDLRSNSMQEMAQAAAKDSSQTNDYLKDIAAGAETHLNTREFLYFTYFNRIKKKLREHWEPLIHTRVHDMVKRGRTIASTGAKITRLVITLDDRGGLSRVQVATTSGLEDLDDVAIEALRVSAPFPNPPKDLIENGYVRINWDFILES